MTLVDSEEQREQGIEDTPDALVADLKKLGHRHRRRRRAPLRELGDDDSLILQELGVAKSTDVITKAPGSSIARTLTLDPKDHQQSSPMPPRLPEPTIASRPKGRVWWSTAER